jgi:hypothetical protein
MIKNPAHIYLILIVMACACNQPNPTKSKNTNNKENAVTCKLDTAHFLNFEFSKVIAFSSLSPVHSSDYLNPGSKKITDTTSVTLNKNQILLLDSVLSGYYNSPNIKVERHADCFHPRHNILFLDKTSKVVQYVSICFECSNSQSSKPHFAHIGNLGYFIKKVGLEINDLMEEQY